MTLECLHLNSDQVSRYKEALDAVSNNHPYYKPEFLDLFYGGIERAKALLYSDEKGNPLIIMPFYLRTIEVDQDPKLYDVISTWGYSGPAFEPGISEEIIKSFWAEVDKWYVENNVISEFVRFKLNHNHEYYSGTLVEGMSNIKGILRDPEEIWGNYNRKVRKNINRARREGLTVKLFFDGEIDDDVFDQFYKIFEHTMDRTQASADYYYSREKLKNFIDKNPANAAIVLTYLADRPISSELVLVSDHSVYSFIGGTLSDYFGLRPNEILKNEIIIWAFNKGIKYFVLGGGYGKDDGIFRYKQAFFPDDVCSFYTGRKILNEEAYRTLSGMDNQKIDIEEDFFPLYRKPALSE
ncbi:MAG: GNAT family N-acetyltransferase [Flavobacteriaceae bacterium]|nr:GNAT family N-acetyltransferase [Flavobacteriaceae bacterium]